MKKTLRSASINGKVKAPFSKSFTQRAIALALLSEGSTRIINPALCTDTTAAINIAQNLGAEIKIKNNNLEIKGGLMLVSPMLSACESGLAVRMFPPIAALLNTEININGEGSLINRPVSMMEGPLNELGVNIASNNGHLPLRIKGPLLGGSTSIDGSISSQFLTGLLMALPVAMNDSEINVQNLQSVPYIDMTLSIMKHFGVQVENQNYQNFKIKGKQKYKATEYVVEGDWSNAAFFLVAGVISGKVEITGLNPQSKQADIAILEALKLAGASLKISEESIVVEKLDLKAFEFDATHCPDLFPPLVILAAVCKGKSTIKGIHRLIHKESNRAIVLQTELGQIGVNIELKDDQMIIQGGTITGGKINSNNDHRIAMAGAIASSVSKNSITIQQAEAVNKSYPEFYKDFETICK